MGIKMKVALHMLGLICSIGITFLQSIENRDISCIGPKNIPVDWFIIYKPRRTFQYFYMLDSFKTWNWTEFGLNDSRNFVASTLNQIYSEQAANYVMYNDQPPSTDRVYSEKAHSKEPHHSNVPIVNMLSDHSAYPTYTVHPALNQQGNGTLTCICLGCTLLVGDILS